MQIANKNDTLFCGDTHGDLTQVQRAIDKFKPKSVILLGDIQAEKPLHEILTGAEVYWITGNHDADEPHHYANLFESEYAANNLHGRVVEINGLKVAGLGGVFSKDVWIPPDEPIYDNLDAWIAANQYKDPYFDKHKIKHEYCTIFYDDYINLMMQQADILVMHDAPSCHPYGFEVLDELAREMGVKTFFHGDHHDSLDYSEDTERMGFDTHGVGLRGVTNLAGERVIAGELDMKRFEDRMAKKKSKADMFGAGTRIGMRM